MTKNWRVWQDANQTNTYWVIGNPPNFYVPSTSGLITYYWIPAPIVAG